MSTYRHIEGYRIVQTFEGVAFLRMDHGLVRILRKANEQEPEYHTYDPYVTIAIIRLGEGGRIERS
jgi:hypothetical protein